MRIGTAFGIPIRIHLTFLLLVIWFAAASQRAGDNLVLAIVLLLLAFACVVLHELGHALAARGFGVRTRDIVLYPFGGIARLENIPAGRPELLIALAGPAVNLVLALLLVLVLGAGLFSSISLDDFNQRLLTPADLLLRILLINGMLLFFNLIPAFPMDGGRVLRAGLALALSEERATVIAAAVGQGIAILFGLAGLVAVNLPLMFIALFVFLGATQEAAFFRQRALLRGRSARDAMITRFDVLAPEESLARAAQNLVAGAQQQFPVVNAWNQVVGVLSRSRLVEGLRKLGGSAGVLEVMDREVRTIPAETSLEQVLQLLRSDPRSTAMVVQEGQLVGMITLSSLIDYLQLTRAGAADAGTPPRAADGPAPLEGTDRDQSTKV